MSEILSTLAFALMIGAQFLAVVAVHRLKNPTQADHASASETPRFSDHNLFLMTERLHGSSGFQSAPREFSQSLASVPRQKIVSVEGDKSQFRSGRLMITREYMTS